jgi:hypothetical protein
MLSLQNIVFCNLINNVLIKREYRLTEHDNTFADIFNDMNVFLNTFSIKDKYDIDFIKNYKIHFSILFKRFFIVYKKIVEICMLSVSDIDKININNIHPVKKTIDLFNDNLMYMLKRRDYNELYNNG